MRAPGANHVEPRWGPIPIADIRYSDVQAWVAELAGRARPRSATGPLGAGPHPGRRGEGPAAGANPARGVKLPKRPPRRNVYLTAAQLDRLADESGRYRSLVLLLGIGGLRWGEAAALRVCDVDFLRRRIELHRNAVMVGGRVMVGTLKTDKNRTVAVPAFVIEALARDRRGKGRDDLLWPSPSGGYLGRRRRRSPG